MPRPSKGARLYFSESDGYWIIRDGERKRSTGCRFDDRAGAEAVLSAYLAEKHEPDFGKGDPARVLIADVLTLYGRERAPLTRRPDVVASAIPHLIAFWGDQKVSHIIGGTCRAYTAWRTAQPQARYKDPKAAPRVGSQTARRELDVLSAAIGYAHREGKLRYPVPVALPDKKPSRERWLTRDEVARLLWAAWRAEQGKSRHLARFILVCLYTGTRHDAVLKLRWLPSTDAGWVDLRGGIIYRRGGAEAESKKRRTPVPISDRLAAHLQRWQRTSIKNVVEWQGLPVSRMRRSWNTARKAAGLGPEVTPHVLRHTFATWAIQDGVPAGRIAGALGTTEKVIERVYGHHAPEYLRDVVRAVSGGVSGGPVRRRYARGA